MQDKRRYEYSFLDWNDYIKDSIQVSYSLDTTYVKSPSLYGVWDDAQKHFSYSSDSIFILISYYWDNGIPFTDSQFIYYGNIETLKIKDWGRAKKIDPPKLIKKGDLNGVYVLYKNQDLVCIEYRGQSIEQSTYFAIEITDLDKKTDIKKVLYDLLASFKVQRASKSKKTD